MLPICPKCGKTCKTKQQIHCSFACAKEYRSTNAKKRLGVDSERDRFIAEEVAKGSSYVAIGAMLGLSRARVHQIAQGYRLLYRPLRLKIVKRDHYQCVACSDTKRLEVHHIDGDTSNNIPENLITLCKSCHARADRLMRAEQGKTYRIADAIKAKTEPYTCKGCGAEGMRSVKANKTYCSNECWVKTREANKLTVEQKREKWRLRMRAYAPKRYATDPEYRKKIGSYNYKASHGNLDGFEEFWAHRERLRAMTPQEKRAYYNERTKEWQRKNNYYPRKKVAQK